MPIWAFYYFVGSMSFFLSIISFSFSQVGFGGVYLGFLSKSSWALSFLKLGFGNCLVSFFPISFGISHLRVVLIGAADLSHADPTHLYPVLLFSNPVPGFIEFLSQLDFLSLDSLGCFFSSVFQNGFRDFSSLTSYFGLLAT